MTPGQARRPLLDVRVDELEQPIRCLIDTGSLRTRLPAWIADVASIDLSSAPTEAIRLGGIATTAHQAHAVIDIAGLGVPASVWFCDPWEAPFGLIGQEDVLRAFRLTYSAAGEWFSLEPEAGTGRP
jgi:hypothetical protein